MPVPQPPPAGHARAGAELLRQEPPKRCRCRRGQAGSPISMRSGAATSLSPRMNRTFGTGGWPWLRPRLNRWSRRPRRMDVAEMADVARPTQRQVVSELGDVLHDLPAFLTAPLYRRWHLRWGATPAEAAASLPGDALRNCLASPPLRAARSWTRCARPSRRAPDS